MSTPAQTTTARSARHAALQDWYDERSEGVWFAEWSRLANASRWVLPGGAERIAGLLGLSLQELFDEYLDALDWFGEDVYVVTPASDVARAYLTTTTGTDEWLHPLPVCADAWDTRDNQTQVRQWLAAAVAREQREAVDDFPPPLRPRW